MLSDKYPHFKACEKDHVVVQTDQGDHTVTMQDVLNYGKNFGSGMSCLGFIMGDHRCIDAIYEDVLAYFEEEYPEELEAQRIARSKP